jgi:hypothetical protein
VTAGKEWWARLGARSLRFYAVPITLPLVFLVFFLGSGCLSSGADTTSPVESKYSRYFSFKNDLLVFKAPFFVVLNDTLTTSEADLHQGDFIRIPETEESADILTAIEITGKYALVEYRHYSGPPAPDTPETYRIKIDPSDN